MNQPTLCRAARGGFTLIELLVVIAIIGVLSAIALVAGGKVFSSAKASTTQDVLRVLDTAMEAFISEKGAIPPATVELSLNPGQAAQQRRVFAAADAYDADGQGMMNSLGYFMAQAREVPSAKRHLDGVPQKFLKRLRPTTSQPELETFVDAWDRPIRYVHPAFHGVIVQDTANATPGGPRDITTLEVPSLRQGQQWGVQRLRRNSTYLLTPPVVGALGADGDGGRCQGGRPYFYSAGEDGKVGTEIDGTLRTNRNADNVYTTVPSLPPV
ncbi:MAG: type II secretion system protein [Phycisphaeraceae bacterium]|nr:type II secretion system protein [Phycisphaeraceae bacterium]